MAKAPLSLSNEIAAALQWWREAGVEIETLDEPAAWLAEPEQPARANEPDRAQIRTAQKPRESEPREAPAPALLKTELPDTLAAFREWWLSAPALEAVASRPRLAPRGKAGARLMVLVLDPEESDSNRLLSGPQGRLLSRFLLAAGLDEDEEVYVASALPCHTPLADAQEIAAKGYGRVIAHHVALVRPHRILAFGNNILPILPHDAAQTSANLLEINHAKGKTPAMVADGLESLLAMPRLKRRLWRRWLEWTEGSS